MLDKHELLQRQLAGLRRKHAKAREASRVFQALEVSREVTGGPHLVNPPGLPAASSKGPSAPASEEDRLARAMQLLEMARARAEAAAADGELP